MVDAAKLRDQADFFMSHAARCAALLKDDERFVDRNSVADRRDRFVLLWQRMTTSDAAEVQLREYIKLAKLAITGVLRRLRVTIV